MSAEFLYYKIKLTVFEWRNAGIWNITMVVGTNFVWISRYSILILYIYMHTFCVFNILLAERQMWRCFFIFKFIFTLWLRRSVNLTASAVTLSWALLIDALWNFLVVKPTHRDKVSSIKGGWWCIYWLVSALRRF